MPKQIRGAPCAASFRLTPAKCADGLRGVLIEFDALGKKRPVRMIVPDALLIELLQKIPLAMASHDDRRQ